jgi:cysteinyl-tRNA synthetase
MSIGEAEDYRFYWQDGWEVGDPTWLDAVNPNWEGNYKVRYWEAEWQQLIFDYTDRLIAAGFDGAYLDIIDAYQYFIDQGVSEEGDESPARRMADLVAAIAAHARAKDPDFLIFPQNAPELASMVPDYLDYVDGIGQEDIYYGYDEDNGATPAAVTAELERHLDLFRERGKLVLTIDYAASSDNIDEGYARSAVKGYVPFVTLRELNQLTINPGHEPD